MKRHMLLGVLLAALGAAGVAQADEDDCQVPMERWQPRDAVQRAFEARGWQVGRIRIDDGCYEVRGTDAQGAGIRATLDPATLEVVEIRRRDHEGGDRRDDEDDDDDGDDDGREGGRQRRDGQNAPRVPVPAGSAPPVALPPPGGLMGAPPAAVVR